VNRHKPNLDAFSDRRDVIYVITMFNEIEHSLTSILIDEIGAPKEKQGFLKDILFNNAILPFSAKVKLFLHIRAAHNWPKIDANAFHQLMQIRNQFAHSRRTQHVTLAINEAKSETTIVEEKIMMSSISGSGELLAVDTAKALDEFTQQWVKVSDYLRELRKKKKI
jgi:hypothetical protein